MTLADATTHDSTTSKLAWLRAVAQTGAHSTIVLLVCGLLLAHLVRIAIAPYTFWLDEAMLLANIGATGWGDLLRPLPFYDQAAPLLYLALLKLFHGVAGLSETALRAPSWLAAAAGIGAAFALPRLSWTERCLVAAAMAGSDVLARTATDVKPYAFDLLGAMALICVFHPDAAQRLRAPLVRLAVLLLTLFTASSFALMAFAVAAPLLLTRLREAADARQAANVLLREGWVFAAALAAFAAYYTLYVAPSYGLVVRNYAYAYEGIGFHRGEGPAIVWFLRQLMAIVTSHFTPMTALAGVLLLLGIYAGAKARSVYLAQGLALLALIALLNALRLYPLIEDRFTLFLLPWMAIAIALGGGFLLELLPRPARQAGLLALAMGLAWPAIDFARDPHHQDAHRTLRALAADPATPVVVTIAAQPIYELYAGGAAAAVVRDRAVCEPAIAGAATDRCTRAKAPGDGDFLGAQTKWYLMNYIAVAGWDGESYAFPGKSLPALTASYHAALTQELARHPRAHLFAAQLTQRDIDRIGANLRPHGTLTLIADDRPSSPTRGWGAARLYLFERAPPRPN